MNTSAKEELLAHAIWASPFCSVREASAYISWFARIATSGGVTDWDRERMVSAEAIVDAYYAVHGGATHPCG